MKRFIPIMCRIAVCSPLAVSSFFITACAKSETAAVAGTNEASHPLLRKAEQRSRARDIDGAIALYNNALAEDPGLSHAHMMLGLIFEENKENYTRAIYHYERFLEIKPRTQKRDLVEQSIRHCRISFAATMKEADGDKLDLIQVLRADKKRLEERNEELSQTINRMSERPRSGVREGEDIAAVSLDNRGRSANGGSPTVDRSGSGTILRATNPVVISTGKASVAAPAARTYRVVARDSLSTISKKMYGESSRWKEIYEANRDTMRSQNDLKIGQELQIP